MALETIRVRGDVVVSCRERTTVSMVARKAAQGNQKGLDENVPNNRREQCRGCRG